ncbi:hypothetical protein D6S42_07665 [Salmonella enterica subsp. enterica serovar Kottbus]|nr:hypothetical protein [Salmonella enterica subsp. diarizonae]EBU9929661.1 hypothetical protein [Salmonella enterica subsp. enterica serovar Thompson]EBX4417113.1 hypothetical protein [Salmonella enterica subsp. enterica serovar Kottbus]EBY8710915.1 hypothetical protein [Salmonella enterica subsp. enterica serovar Kottbus]
MLLPESSIFLVTDKDIHFRTEKSIQVTAHSPQHKKDTIVICGAEIPMLRKYPILGYLRKQMIFDFGIRIGY